MEKVSELGEILRGAKNILIGAGAGMSTAANAFKNILPTSEKFTILFGD